MLGYQHDSSRSRWWLRSMCSLSMSFLNHHCASLKRLIAVGLFKFASNLIVPYALKTKNHQFLIFLHIPLRQKPIICGRKPKAADSSQLRFWTPFINVPDFNFWLWPWQLLFISWHIKINQSNKFNVHGYWFPLHSLTFGIHVCTDMVTWSQSIIQCISKSNK